MYNSVTDRRTSLIASEWSTRLEWMFQLFRHAAFSFVLSFFLLRNVYSTVRAVIYVSCTVFVLTTLTSRSENNFT